MERLIDANALLKAINKFPYGYRGMIESEIENQPTVDAEPIRHGKWVDTQEKEEWYGKLYRCSLCGSGLIGTDNYCPHCGARMDAE